MATTEPDAARWLTDVEQQAWRSFVTGTRRLFEFLDQEGKQRGLNHDDYGILVALSEAPEGRLRMSDLAHDAVESRSRLSRHVSRMEARGLVQRESCPDDRRGSLAVLTTDGRALMAEIAPHHVAAVRAMFLDHLEGDELAVIGRVFARVDAALTGTEDARLRP